jgi:hypothetical protein
VPVGNDGVGDDMNFIALKMLIGDRAKYFGIIIGLTFAYLLITQQSAIFAGIMTRTFSFITDDSTERVDTRVLQAIYGFYHGQVPIYVGQQTDIYIEAPAHPVFNETDTRRPWKD